MRGKNLEGNSSGHLTSSDVRVSVTNIQFMKIERLYNLKTIFLHLSQICPSFDLFENRICKSTKSFIAGVSSRSAYFCFQIFSKSYPKNKFCLSSPSQFHFSIFTIIVILTVFTVFHPRRQRTSWMCLSLTLSLLKIPLQVCQQSRERGGWPEVSRFQIHHCHITIITTTMITIIIIIIISSLLGRASFLLFNF